MAKCLLSQTASRHALYWRRDRQCVFCKKIHLPVWYQHFMASLHCWPGPCVLGITMDMTSSCPGHWKQWKIGTQKKMLVPVRDRDCWRNGKFSSVLIDYITESTKPQFYTSYWTPVLYDLYTVHTLYDFWMMLLFFHFHVHYKQMFLCFPLRFVDK